MKLADALLTTLVGATGARSFSFNPADYAANDVIRSDVTVIGGGGSGAYTAVRLKDHGHSVVVIDEKSRLGGHAETYTDPINGYTIDIGVLVFGPTTIVENYFKHFNIPLITLPTAGPSSTEYFNPSTGKLVQGYKPPNSTAYAAALSTYSKQLAKYSYLTNGFNLTYPVAEELLEPWGNFITKYNLEALFPQMFVQNQGAVQILEIPTLYMIKYFNQDQVDALEKGFKTTENHDIAALYDAVAKYLGAQNLLLSSSVAAMHRSNEEVCTVVKTETGNKLVISKKLVSAISPTLANLKGYDLSSHEKGLFGQFFANGYATGVLNNTGLVQGTDVNYLDPTRPLNVPELPNPYGFSVNSGTNLTQIYYGSPRPQSDGKVKAEIIASLQTLQKALQVKERGGDFVAFSNHVPFNLMTTTDAIRKGFYRDIHALDGQNSTFWNGAFIQTQSSTSIWDYTEKLLLPRILEALQ